MRICGRPGRAMGAQQRDEVDGCGERCLVFVAAAAGVESAAVQQCSSAAVRRRRSRTAIPPAGVGARRRRCQGCGGGWLARKQRATALQPPSVPPARIELPRGSWSQSAPEARLSRLLECPIQAYCHASAASSREPPGQSIFLRWRSPTAKTPRIDSIVPTAHLTSAARLTLKKWLCTTTADYSVTPSST